MGDLTLARAPFQTLIIPFRRISGPSLPEVAILLRWDQDAWQFAAGGGPAKPGGKS